MAEVARDHVGLILGSAGSRPARNGKDWHLLLALCGRCGTRRGDGEDRYDPTDYQDRLRLGIKGIRRAAERPLLRDRWHGAQRNKARRGERLGLPPIGYVKLPTGAFAIDPDEPVQAVVRLIFDPFDREGTVHGLRRSLVPPKILIPVRGRRGAPWGRRAWHRPNRPTRLNRRHHPISAGAYRYGQRALDPRQQQPGRRRSGKQFLPPEQCRVLLRDRRPAYSSWERCGANPKRREANRATADSPGPARPGAARRGGLLPGGRCDRRMPVRYAGRKGLPSSACPGNTSD